MYDVHRHDQDMQRYLKMDNAPHAKKIENMISCSELDPAFMCSFSIRASQLKNHG